ncbi:hypothetical protein SAMN05192574_102356 [Mucilaginibacter gossypiicola]|uniref:Cthe-2314-like HEPN domain-containing protein n=1 Tax=Mucilaginibacter gossypiicola TaxID=551995 RepID=A0A1H8DK86_9SPHI|nr:Cthe_2314 family HEPN domain-containing protein [Mucilaginibacter gossypiicola]SEN06958.1 hypothetical protein SAMN05192574_102356 [Mucilaginibacter gossypiicola]
MTNEEFAAMKAADTQFIEAVACMFSEFCVELKGEKLNRFIATPLGGYLWKTNHIISEINQNLDDIKLAETLIAAFMPSDQPLKKEVNAAELIRYHYENYLLRTTKLKDLTLTLINTVMRLGHKKGLGLESKLLKNLDPTYGQFEVIWGHMNQLNDHVKPYRNHLAHSGTVQHQDLALLNAHYTWGIKPKTIAEEFRYEKAMIEVQRELIEKFTAQTKAYPLASDQVLKMIYLYLAKPFFDQMGVLVDEHYQRKPVGNAKP